MIYYYIDPILSSEECEISESTLKNPDHYTLDSRVTKLVHSSKPSDVALFCSQFRNDMKTKGKNENVILHNQSIAKYNENDIIEIIHSLNVAENNFLLEKELYSVVNYFLMKEICPKKMENIEIPYLYRFRTDYSFRLNVERILKKYRPLKFNLSNIFVDKRDVGVQSPKRQPTFHKNNKKYNKDVNDGISPTMVKSQKDSNAVLKKKQNKQEYSDMQRMFFLSESDIDNDINDNIQELRNNEYESDNTEIFDIRLDSKNTYNKIFDYDNYSSNSASRVEYINLYSEKENGNNNPHLTKREHHKHKNHKHNSHISKNQTHQHNHNKSQYSDGGELIEIKQEYSSELKLSKKKAKLPHIDSENSLNQIISPSSSENKVKNDEKPYKNKNNRFHGVSNPAFNLKDEDCFEIQFDDDEAVELKRPSNSILSQKHANHESQSFQSNLLNKELSNKSKGKTKTNDLNQNQFPSIHYGEYSSNYNVCSEYDTSFERNENFFNNKDDDKVD